MAATSQSSGAAAYAEALFQASEAAGGLDAAREAGDALTAIAEAWKEDRRLRGFFLSSDVGGSEKRAALDLLGARLPRLTANFLRLVLQKGRLALLPDVAHALAARLDQRLGRVPVSVITAVPMPADKMALWTERLRAAVGREPVVKNVVRPELVGGAVVRIGDTVADGSVRRRLADLARRIVERGAERSAAWAAAPSPKS